MGPPPNWGLPFYRFLLGRFLVEVPIIYFPIRTPTIRDERNCTALGQTGVNMADEIAAALDLAAGSWDWSSGISMNSAFVFIKPHANNEKVKEFVKAQLVEAGLSINYEGVMTGPEIAKAKIIDKRKFFDKFNCGNYIGFLR
jgi:hypothetical protein